MESKRLPHTFHLEPLLLPVALGFRVSPRHTCGEGTKGVSVGVRQRSVTNGSREEKGRERDLSCCKEFAHEIVGAGSP